MLDAEMETKRKRSKSGWAVFSASSITRVLNASHESSRLMKRSGLVKVGVFCACPRDFLRAFAID